MVDMLEATCIRFNVPSPKRLYLKIVDGRIHKAAGSTLIEECKLLDGCEVGQSKITSGHCLPAKYIIHTVGPKRDPVLLKSCYQTVLALALKHDIRSVAFVCVATGVYGYPSLEAAHVALKTVREWLEENYEKVDKLIFCTYLDKDFRIYFDLMKRCYFPCEQELVQIEKSQQVEKVCDEEPMTVEKAHYDSRNAEELNKEMTDSDDDIMNMLPDVPSGDNEVDEAVRMKGLVITQTGMLGVATGNNEEVDIKGEEMEIENLTSLMPDVSSDQTEVGEKFTVNQTLKIDEEGIMEILNKNPTEDLIDLPLEVSSNENEVKEVCYG